MGNPFREAAAAHSAAVDEVFGERLRLRPQVSGGKFGGAGGDDPKRPAREIVGAVTNRPLDLKRTGVGAQSQENVRLAAGTLQVSFAASLQLDVRAGDLVVRLDEPGEPVLRLAEALPIPGRAIHPAEKV